MSGYDSFFQSRESKRGGGVALFIKSELNSAIIPEKTFNIEDCCEVITTNIKIAKKIFR